MRFVAAESARNFGSFENPFGKTRWSSAEDVCRIGGAARRRPQAGFRGDGAGFRRSGLSGGHAYSPAGSALGADQWPQCRANRARLEKTVSGGALESVAPADHLLRARTLYGAGVRRA